MLKTAGGPIDRGSLIAEGDLVVHQKQWNGGHAGLCGRDIDPIAYACIKFAEGIK